MSESNGHEFNAARQLPPKQATREPSLPRMLTVPEVAEFARCEHKAVRKAIHEGALTAYGTNRRLVIEEADAIAWVKSRPVRSIPRPAPRPARPVRSKRGQAGSVQSLREIERNLTR